MKRLLLLCLVLVSVPAMAQKPTDRATCKGKTPCRACKNCRYCAHCNAGGTCGVCKSEAKAVLKKAGQRVAKR